MTLKRNIKKELFWPSLKGSSKRGLKGSVVQGKLMKLYAINVERKKPELRPTKDFEAKYNKVKARLALLSSSASSSKSSMVLMTLTDDENIVVGKESARNGEWVKISMRKVHTLLEMEDNDERKTFIDYLCIDLNYVEEQRNNLMLKHRCLVQELNTCKEQFSNKVNQCISEQISTQKKRILGVDQLTKDPSSFGQKDLVFGKSSADDTKVSIRGVERPWLSEAEGFNLPNHDNANESSVCSTPLPPLEKLASVEHVSGSKTIKSILKSNSTFKTETLKGITINEPTSASANGNKSILASKGNSAPTDKLKNVKTKDDIPLSIVMKELNDLKLQINNNQSSYSKNNKPQQCDIRKPIWYLDSRCSRHMNGVKRYMHKYVEQPGPKFVEKKGIIFSSNKEVVMIAPRVRDVYVLDMTSSLQQSCVFAKASESLNWLWHKRLAHLNFKTINQLAKQNLVLGLPSLVYSKNKPCPLCEKGKHHWASFKTKQTSSINKYLYLLHMDLFVHVTPRSINHEKYTLVIVDEYSRCPIFIHNHKDHLGKFDEKADDGYFLRYLLISKAIRVFNTRRQQTQETYCIIFDESTEAMQFSKPSVDDINIAESERYLPDEYLHPYEPSQRYQVDINVVQYIEPYEKPEPIVTEADASLDQNDQADQMYQNDLNDQNDHPVQADEILTGDQLEHSNHNNDNHMIDNLPNTKDVQITKPLSFSTEDTSTPNAIPIPTGPSSSILSMASPAPQDRWSKEKHIKLVNIIGNPRARMLTRSIAKELSAASAHECLFVEFLSEEEP
ncbi:retrovirus-related pol polyprotein from transposon TNT 1-94 [Tanacetum coccineum]